VRKKKGYKAWDEKRSIKRGVPVVRARRGGKG